MMTSNANIEDIYCDFVSREKRQKIDKIISDVVSRDKQAMADGFYRKMMADDAATAFLSPKSVQTRLRKSLEIWLEKLLCCSTEAKFRDVLAMREKQTAALLDWENRVFRLLAIHDSLDDADFLRDSSFGLWLHHKAPLIFDQRQELAQINDKVQQTDEMLQSCMRSCGGS